MRVITMAKLTTRLVLAFLLSHSMLVVNSQLVLDVFTYDPSCTDTGNVSQVTVAPTAAFSPSCAQVLTYLGINSNEPRSAVKCFGRQSDEAFPPDAVVLTNPITGFAQQYDLFRSIMTPTQSYSDFTAFRVVSCTESGATFDLERSPNQLTLGSAAECYSIAGSSNTSATCMLSQMRYLSLSLDYTIRFNMAQARVERSLTGEVSLPFSSNDLPYGCESSSIMWDLNQDMSSMRQIVTINESYPQFEAGAVSNELMFTTTAVSETDTATMGELGGTNLLLDVAKYIGVRLNPTTTSDVDEITVAVLRSLAVGVTNCSLQYRVLRKTNGDSWGDFLKLTEYNTTVATLSKVSPSSSSSSGGALGVPRKGCLNKCLSTVVVTTPGNGYNPFYSPAGPLAPFQILAGSRTPTFRSGYTGDDCLCGEGSASVVRFLQRSYYTGSLNKVFATVTDVATGDRAFITSGVQVEYTVSSGDAYGASSASMQPSTKGPVLIGATISVLLVFIGLVFLLWLMVNSLSSVTEAAGSYFSKKTTTPLYSVQTAIVFIATSLAIAGVVSSNMVIVLSPFAATPSTTSFGIWYLGQNINNLFQRPTTTTSYPCLQFVESTGVVGDFDYRYVDACGAARAFAIATVVGGVIASGLIWYKRARLAVAIVVVVAVTCAATLGLFVHGVSEGFLVSRAQSNDVIMLGNSAYLLAAAVFFYLCEVVAWVIDWRAGEEELDDMDALPSTPSASRTTRQPKEKPEKKVKEKKIKIPKEKKEKKPKKEKAPALPSRVVTSPNASFGASQTLTASSTPVGLSGPPLPNRNGATEAPYGTEMFINDSETYEDTGGMETTFGTDYSSTNNAPGFEEEYNAPSFMRPQRTNTNEFKGFEDDDRVYETTDENLPPRAPMKLPEEDLDETYEMPERPSKRQAAPLPPPPQDDDGDLYEAVDHPSGRFDGFA
eukprot:m.246138 g.246138  ORF g.246138 m.246138 type:complete len:943 (-) comp33845_c0_seq1:298-3126(-)